MIGQECKHIETGHTGKITNKLNGNEKLPDQWGIYWYGGLEDKEHGDRIAKLGLLGYWNDQDKIESL